MHEIAIRPRHVRQQRMRRDNLLDWWLAANGPYSGAVADDPQDSDGLQHHVQIAEPTTNQQDCAEHDSTVPNRLFFNPYMPLADLQDNDGRCYNYQPSPGALAADLSPFQIRPGRRMLRRIVLVLTKLSAQLEGKQEAFQSQQKRLDAAIRESEFHSQRTTSMLTELDRVKGENQMRKNGTPHDVTETFAEQIRKQLSPDPDGQASYKPPTAAAELFQAEITRLNKNLRYANIMAALRQDKIEKQKANATVLRERVAQLLAELEEQGAVTASLSKELAELVFQTSRVETDTISSSYVALVSKAEMATDVELNESDNTRYGLYQGRKGEIIALFKYLCIKQHFNCLEAAEMHLYGSRRNVAGSQPVQTPKLFFDTVAENTIRVDRPYMVNLHHMQVQFDSVLAHVSLPKWDPSRPSKAATPEAIANMESTFPAEIALTPNVSTSCWGPYQEVFDWLREWEGVRRILKVTVDDLGDMPHSDQAIVNCLRNLKVEIFDWRKTDISINAVQEAAPNVEELYLYSTGRKPALIGWSCKHALVGLKKLQKLHVIFQPGPESRETLETYFQEFQDRVAKHCPHLTSKVDVQYLSSSLHGAGEPSPDQEQTRGRTSSWIKSAKEFSGYVNTLPQMLKIPKPTVRVAIIDDGIQPGDTKIKVVAGKSFWRAGIDGEFKDFWVSPGAHGIEMAHYVTEACPMADLVIARVSSRVGRDGKPCPEANTVASAIRWAAEQDIDIMSISLTIRKSTTNQNQIDEITSAVRDAYNKNIVIFASLSDQKPENDADVFPAALPKVIAIGAATPEGHAHTTVDATTAKFLLQGVQVPSSTSGSDLLPPVSSSSFSPSKVLTGSSIATALAAGLGGLLVYLERMMVNYDQKISGAHAGSVDDGIGEVGTAGSRRAQLVDMDAMNRMLKKLCQTEDKYLIVWNKLKIEDRSNAKAAFERLRVIMEGLREGGRG